MSPSNASYNGRRSSGNRRIIESSPFETESSIISSRNDGGGGGGSDSHTESLKLYEAIIFSGPIVFTLIIIFLFYFFYLRRHSVDWSSLRMRASNSAAVAAAATDGVEVYSLLIS